MRPKAGDKLKHKTTGEVHTVAAFEEPTGNLRCTHHQEHQWAKVDDYEALEEPKAEPAEELQAQSEPPPAPDGDAA